MRFDIERFIISVMPLIIAMFCITVISILGDNAFIRILLEIPVWGVLLWWMWMEPRTRD